MKPFFFSKSFIRCFHSLKYKSCCSSLITHSKLHLNVERMFKWKDILNCEKSMKTLLESKEKEKWTKKYESTIHFIGFSACLFLYYGNYYCYIYLSRKISRSTIHISLIGKAIQSLSDRIFGLRWWYQWYSWNIIWRHGGGNGSFGREGWYNHEKRIDSLG